MYFKESIGVLMLCLFLGCAVFKKDKSQVTDTSVSSTTDKTTGLPADYDTQSTASADSLVPPAPPVPPPPPKLPLEYMTIEEKAMIDEINLLRADPNAYIQYVDAYIQFIMDDPNWDFNSRQAERVAAEELIQSLQNMPPLELLVPSEELYKVAMAHGKDMKENKFIGHMGSDDSMPEDRIRDSTALVGSENLAAGGRSVRESVLMLLVDANDRASRSHRKTILNSDWKNIACYYAGTVDEIPGTWVQLFGYDDPNEIPEDLPANIADRPSSNDGQTSTSSNSGDLSFLSDLEKSMIAEINLMRSNPKGYISHLEKYVAKEKEMMIGGDPDFDVAVNELKNQLRSMSVLSTLRPHRKLYEVAKAHGIDNKNNHQIEHRGSDGRSSFQRVKDSGLKNNIVWKGDQGDFSPNENLATGTANITVRETVMMLLIDSGIPGRGHRRALIEPAWEYVACYHIDMITNLKDYVDAGMSDTDAPNCWVQFFAKGPDDNPTAPLKKITEQPGSGEAPTDVVETNPTTRSKPTPTIDIPETPSPTVPVTEEPPVPSISTEATGSNTSASGDFSFMSTLEKSMIDEINLMRSNPAAYIKHVDAYVVEEKKMMMGVDADYDVAVNELKSQLRSMGTLSTLKPHQKLFEVAKNHGIDNKNNHQIEHTGSDGRSSFQRVKDSGLKNSISWKNGSGDYAPNENLATGTADITVRETVMMLLIDYGIPGRGHRRALIEPTWEYVACYHIDMITNLKDYVDAGMSDTDAPNCWVQVFAKGPDDNGGGSNSGTTTPSKPDPSSVINETKPTARVDKPELTKPETTSPAGSSTVSNSDQGSGAASGDFSFMSLTEKSMIDEVNKMRADPKAYAKVLDEFAAKERVGMSNVGEFDQAVSELRSELMALDSLSVLKPYKKLHDVAIAHGTDNRNNNMLEHTGSDGRNSFKRVKDSGLNNNIVWKGGSGDFSPNENLATGYSEVNVRSTVMMLLIDAGIASRGHRRALLDPAWKYIACYHIGTIERLPDLGGDDAPNCWVQLFAKD